MSHFVAKFCWYNLCYLCLTNLTITIDSKWFHHHQSKFFLFSVLKSSFSTQVQVSSHHFFRVKSQSIHKICMYMYVYIYIYIYMINTGANHHKHKSHHHTSIKIIYQIYQHQTSTKLSTFLPFSQVFIGFHRFFLGFYRFPSSNSQPLHGSGGNKYRARRPGPRRCGWPPRRGRSRAPPGGAALHKSIHLIYEYIKILWIRWIVYYTSIYNLIHL